MPKPHSPRHGSMQYWPRKRAKRLTPRLRSWYYANLKPIAGFIGYKAGMVHVIAIDNRKNSLTKGMEISIPATVLEVPDLGLYSVRLYKNSLSGLSIKKEVVLGFNKNLARKMPKPKTLAKDDELKKLVQEINPDLIGLLVYNNPSFKKTPELIEFKALPNTQTDTLNIINWILEHKTIKAEHVLTKGVFVNVHAVTKGKGLQGPVRRFGIGLKSHKSEKGRRTPGSLGPWNAQGKIMWRTAKSGQHGFHLRTEYNKLILDIGNDPGKINPPGGFHRYGLIKASYLLLAGSVPGSVKRSVVVTLTPRKQEPMELVHIVK